MKDRDYEDVYLQRIIELHELFDSLSDLIYQHTHDINSTVRYKEARKKFCIALIKLGVV
jgi:hypothetical protein